MKIRTPLLFSAMLFAGSVFANDAIRPRPFSQGANLTPITTMSDLLKSTQAQSRQTPWYSLPVPLALQSHKKFGAAQPGRMRTWSQLDLIDPKFVITPKDLSQYRMPVILPDLSIDPKMAH